MKTRPIFLPFAFLLFTSLSFAQTLAPGGPGKDAQWATAGKQGIGTSATLESKVWFTLAQGVMTEVYYPDVTTANVHLLQFVVVNPKTKKVETEQDDATHEIKVLRPDSLTFQQINTAKSGEWKISKTYTVDPELNSVLISVNYSGPTAKKLYVFYDPSLGNSGMHDTAWSEGRVLLSSDGDTASAVKCGNCKFDQLSSGFLGISDGYEQLKKDGKLTVSYDRAANGNVAQLAGVSGATSIEWSRLGSKLFEIVIGFGNTPDQATRTADASAKKGFKSVQLEFEKGWADYVKTIPKVDPKYQAQFNMAAMQLKANEDKTHRGANVASLTIPWGGGANANENNVGGYHLVWSRDLYHVFTAYMALGDTAAANRALDFVFNVQQKPDGSLPQNSFLDGKPFWGSLQLDEVGYPLIMAWQLGRFDTETYEKHVRPAADFIIKNGPATPQERWEERPGYSPSTIAAEITGLVCAAEIANKNGDTASANKYLATADDWQANIEKWTATKTGKYGDGNYYLRITANGKPDAGEKVELNNGAGTFDEREIVDAGFLELVRLGIKPADDPLIAKSVKIIDQLIKVDTPNGPGFYRYNHDGYGEMDDGRRWNWDGKYTGKGRLWALLSGERGQYEIAECGVRDADLSVPPAVAGGAVCLDRVRKRLDAMLGFANDGLMIPEQVWDKKETPKNADKQFVPELKFGEGTGSATPLAWSMAQFIRLATNLKAGHNLDTPQIVYDRYVLGKGSSASTLQKPPYNSKYTIDCSKDERLGRTSGLAEYSQTIKSSPVINRCQSVRSEAMFFFKAGTQKVEIVGDFTEWKPRGLELKYLVPESLDPSPITKYIVLDFEPKARVEYKLIVDGKWILDPLNPNKIDNGVGGENSFFTMPDYVPSTWAKDVKGLEPSLETIEIQSRALGETRKVSVFAFTLGETERYDQPVLYLEDGGDYVKRGKALEVWSNLVAAKKLSPFIIVFLDPKDRMKEYWANDKWADFVANEVVPEIDKRYHTIANREGRALLGASLGGITSFWIGLKYPDKFARIGGQSSSFWIDDERVVKELARLDVSKTKFKFYIDDGTLEGTQDSHKVVKILHDKGFDVTYVEGEAGHNWTAWRDRLAGAFMALWK